MGSITPVSLRLDSEGVGKSLASERCYQDFLEDLSESREE